MPLIPQARFNEFLQDIEPSATTKSNASSAHQDLRNFLRTDPEFKGYHKADFLSGSYKRDTSIRPRKKEEQIDRPDIDIIIVTNHQRNDNPREVVDFLFRVLRKKYPNIRRQTRSVGIQFHKADMDVVPIIPNGNIYLIPDRSQEEWVDTNPSGHTDWTIQTNRQAGGRFKPLVKLMKWWRRHNRTISKKPKGFVIERITSECMDYCETYYGELFVKTLEGMVRAYSVDAIRGTVPWISDPGIPWKSVTDGMSAEAFIGFYNKIKAHAKLGREALNETDAEKATRLWREIFGERFPRTDSNKFQSLLSPPVRPELLSFPARPVIPNKPKGFA